MYWCIQHLLLFIGRSIVDTSSSSSNTNEVIVLDHPSTTSTTTTTTTTANQTLFYEETLDSSDPRARVFIKLRADIEWLCSRHLIERTCSSSDNSKSGSLTTFKSTELGTALRYKNMAFQLEARCRMGFYILYFLFSKLWG